MKTTNNKNLSPGALALFVLLLLATAPVSIFAQKSEQANEPKVEGSKFSMPDYPEPGVSKEEFDKQLGVNLKKVESPTAKEKAPGARTRGNNTKNNCGVPGYVGMCGIYQFVNTDFPTTNNSCGQAAATTAMWNVALKNNYSTPQELAKSFYDYAPPKIIVGGLVQVQGSLGSDWRQLNYGMDGYKNYGVKYSWLKGENELKKYLGMQLPALIMLDTGTLSQYGYKWFTGHWVVAYGYDANGVYVTNFPNNKMSWADLRKAWGGVWNEGQLAKVHGTPEMFAVVWK